MDRVGLGWVEPTGWTIFLLLLLLLLNWTKIYISLAIWVDKKKKIHELIFQLSYKQNISNWVDKQNIHELVSQFNCK